MKATLAFVVGATLLFQGAFAAPTNNVAPENPLADFPKLGGIGTNFGFYNVDLDGIYRAYLANGTIVDAARLTRDQINTWLDARAGQLSEAQAAEERASFAEVDPHAVPEAQLLKPPLEVQPTAFFDTVSPRHLGPLLETRQTIPLCQSLQYCVYDPSICYYYPGCVCNGAICAAP